MMKARNAVLHILCISGGLLMAAEQRGGGPMNAARFYDETNPYKQANELYQNRQWKDAADLYEKLLKDGVGDADDQNNANVNRASCEWAAERKASDGWAGFDKLINIAEDQQVSREKIENAKDDEKKSILVRTDTGDYKSFIGIGDDFHFIRAAGELKRRTGWDVTISVPNFLKAPLSGAADAYGLKMVGAKDEQPKTDYITHLVGLIGHLKMKPSELAPERPLFTTTERAHREVMMQVAPQLIADKKIVVVFLGENRQATLIGGKQLPRDITKHGRHLDSKPFITLLRNNFDVVLMDCGTKDSRVALDEDQKNQYMQLASEEQPFDTIIALALAMNKSKNIVAVAADNGPANVFARALNEEAQRRMTFIIPNGSKSNGEYDMRMEGEGSEYTQMLSNCRVYKCETPADQTAVIEKAYQDMAK